MSLRQAMDKLFEDSFVRPSHTLAALDEVTVLALDIYQTPNDVQYTRGCYDLCYGKIRT
jgi:hypothetical protein